MIFSRAATIIALAIGVIQAAPLAKRINSGLLLNCKKGSVALAFDDGPFQFTGKLLDTLRDAHVPATFFVNGNNYWDIATNADARATIKRAFDEGHQIGSHTYSHAHLPQLTDDQIKLEMQKVEDLVEGVIGERPAFMRPPYGEVDDHVIGLLNGIGYMVVNWSVDTKDYETHNLADEMARVEEDTSDSSHGAITLAHDVFGQTAEELAPKMIQYFSKKGFTFVTVAECYGASAYK
ncbi:Carbohydrate esterase 4 protein [Apophysomyces sp. BC1034]|nr:Carbohydrate esterase 4 protein [Apophysomyces sp. BC1015]KAG0178752.1 Carbohydrate esterase 4 protein [Apophysomyces sp. BC1021]KAG0191438.1 Carbohydrate esterase 4 protein [Apophysomyces sp. BC1034]